MLFKHHDPDPGNDVMTILLTVALGALLGPIILRHLDGPPDVRKELRNRLWTLAGRLQTKTRIAELEAEIVRLRRVLGETS